MKVKSGSETFNLNYYQVKVLWDNWDKLKAFANDSNSEIVKAFVFQCMRANVLLLPLDTFIPHRIVHQILSQQDRITRYLERYKPDISEGRYIYHQQIQQRYYKNTKRYRNAKRRNQSCN